jgi:hypothetical protein
MDIRKLYWAAGFLDGEGCFHSNRGTISASQVSPQTLYWLKAIFGGSVYGPVKRHTPKQQPFFQWRISGGKYGGDAISIMMMLYPLLSEKRQGEIRRCIEAWRKRPGNSKVWLARGHCRNGHPLSGPNYVVAPSGHGRCRQCGIEGRKRYYQKHPEKWVEYARQYAARKKAAAQGNETVH